MTVTGRVRGGAIVLDAPIPLADGTEVRVQVDQCPQSANDVQIPSLLEQFRELVGVVDGLPEDFAERHDHYLHGTTP